MTSLTERHHHTIEAFSCQVIYFLKHNQFPWLTSRCSYEQQRYYGLFLKVVLMTVLQFFLLLLKLSSFNWDMPQASFVDIFETCICLRIVRFNSLFLRYALRTTRALHSSFYWLAFLSVNNLMFCKAYFIFFRRFYFSLTVLIVAAKYHSLPFYSLAPNLIVVCIYLIRALFWAFLLATLFISIVLLRTVCRNLQLSPVSMYALFSFDTNY